MTKLIEGKNKLKSQVNVILIRYNFLSEGR